MMEQENQDNTNAQGVSFTESIMQLLVMPGNDDPQPLLFTCLFDCLNINIVFLSSTSSISIPAFQSQNVTPSFLF